MGLSPEEKAQLDKLTAKANEPDEDDNFEIEIYDETGRGARVPYRKGRGWLQQHFGIDLDPDPEGDSPDDGDDDGQGAPKQKAPTRQKGQGAKDAQPAGYWSKRSRANAS